MNEYEKYKSKLPDNKHGKWLIEHFDISKEEVADHLFGEKS